MVRQYDTSRQNIDPFAMRFNNPFLLDRHRVLHSTSFRRLGYKTQVFLPLEADHFRTRLTHTLEVAHVAILLAERFDANPLLAEVIGLAHDLGHGPFGHSSETALNKLMADAGGFEHNDQSIRVVEFLEGPYPWFRGLNLTRSTLAGLEAHTTPYDRTDQGEINGHLEGQLVNWADRLAYNSADLEDALGADFITAEELQSLPLYQRAWEMIPQELRDRPIHALRRVALENLQYILINHIEIQEATGETRITLRDEELNQLIEIENFLLNKVYHSERLTETATVVQEIIARLFNRYCDDPELLPKRYLSRQAEISLDKTICDYISGMTDRFCLKTYRQLFGEQDELLRSIQPVIGTGS
ncbi:MAG: dNTP triphosphohydrolase, partial [Phycisphaerae bacterium]|jgi:dGTPase|nr:dNTP triphosphohydrolase [Phycisphaerae bacterium]